MEEKSFLPDGSEVRSRLLARAPYSADAMAAISAGADPATLSQEPPPGGTWGLLYATDSLFGFFSARSEPTMLGFSIASGAEAPAPVNIEFPADASLDVSRGKRFPGTLGALIGRFVAIDDDVAVVRWRDETGSRELRFVVDFGDVESFERAFATIRR